MAEASSKRQHFQGKAPVTATTKSPQPSTSTASANNVVSVDTAVSVLMGARVRLYTTMATIPVIEGVIHLVDPNFNILAIAERPPKVVQHIIAFSALKDFQILPKDAFPCPPLPPAGPPQPLNTEVMMARANAALADAKAKAAKRNPDVSKEAQEIFDALGRQLPVRWEKKDIVVMDQVIVRGPGYKGEDCKAGKDVAQGTLARVKKVLENERKRLSQRDLGSNPASKGPKPVIPAIPAIPAFRGEPRKGG